MGFVVWKFILHVYVPLFQCYISIFTIFKTSQCSSQVKLGPIKWWSISIDVEVWWFVLCHFSPSGCAPRYLLPVLRPRYWRRVLDNYITADMVYIVRAFVHDVDRNWLVLTRSFSYLPNKCLISVLKILCISRKYRASPSKQRNEINVCFLIPHYHISILTDCLCSS